MTADLSLLLGAHVLTSLGSSFVRCTLRPSHATTWCLAMRERIHVDDGRSVEDCRACPREIAWAVARQPTTRDLKGRAA